MPALLQSLPDVEKSPAGFTVRILGDFKVHRDGTPLDTASWQPRVCSLFLLIATAPRRCRLRDEVIDTLWPDATPETGPGNLRYTLHMLRRALGHSEVSPVLFERGWISLNPDYTWEIDLERFDTPAAASPDNIITLEEVAALYRGEPLVDQRYEDWARPVRDRVQRRWRDLCLALARAYRARGSHHEAVEWLERTLESDPLDEQAMLELLGLLAEGGRRAEALRRYQGFERRLRRELDVSPGAEIVALADTLKGRIGDPSTCSGADPVTPDRPAPDAEPPNPPPARPFVGRGDLLAEMRAAVAAVSAGHAPDGTAADTATRLILVAAEAGMGKTHLIRELARSARELDMHVLAGTCYGHEGHLPYAPIHDMFAAYLRAQPEFFLDQIAGLESELGRIVPEIMAAAGIPEEAGGRDSESRRLRMFLAFSQALARIARRRPLLLILDDLHWADNPTLQLLRFLLRQPGLDRVLILGAYRLGEVARDAPLMDLIDDGRDDLVRVIRLEPLVLPDLRLLIEQRLGGTCAPSLSTAVYERSDGNPFFALEIIGLLSQEGCLERASAGWRVIDGVTLDLPPAVRQTIARRVRHVSRDGREALVQAAVLGQRISYTQLEQLWQGTERSLFEALDSALDAHLLLEVEDGYTFRHPLLWEVIYEGIPHPRKSALHARTAAGLEALYGSRADEYAEQIASHLIRTGREHGSRTVHYLLAAGDRAEAVFAHTEAEASCRKALQLIDDDSDLSREAEALEKLGRVLRISGQFDEALETLARGRQDYGAVDDLHGEARVAAQIGRVHHARGTAQEGIDTIEELLHRLPSSPTEPRSLLSIAELSTVLAHNLFANGRYRESADTAARGAEAARRIGNERLLAEVEVRRGTSMIIAGSPGGLVVLENVMPLAERVGQLDILGRGLFNLGCVYLASGACDRARAMFQAYQELATQEANPSQIARALMNLGQLDFTRGNWRDARTHWERARDLVESMGPTRMQEFTHFALRTLACWEGSDDCESCLQDGLTLAALPGNWQMVSDFVVSLVEAALLGDSGQEVFTSLQPSLERLLRDGQPPSLWLQAIVARGRLRAGDIDGAEGVLACAFDQAAGCVTPTHHMWLLMARALLLECQGQSHAADACAEEAYALAHQLHFVPAQACLLSDWAQLLSARGDHGRARERREEALSIARSLRAGALIERIEREQLPLGKHHK